MPIVHALWQGIVQGLTEFFPVSSSGHLDILPWLFGWDDFGGDENLERAFEVFLHLGTLAALLLYFGRDILTVAKSGLLLLVSKEKASPESIRTSHGVPVNDGRFFWKIALSSIPAAGIGFYISSQNFSNQIQTTAALLIVFGLILAFADGLAGRRLMPKVLSRQVFRPDPREADSFGTKDSIFLGFVQALALWPGVSRSGVIISASRLTGFSREAAVRLSFWMSIPVIAGAGLYKLLDLDGADFSDMRFQFLAGALSAFVSGLLAIKGLLYLSRLSFMPFVAERILVGLMVLIVLSTSFR